MLKFFWGIDAYQDDYAEFFNLSPDHARTSAHNAKTMNPVCTIVK
jgi:hypothetical protein